LKEGYTFTSKTETEVIAVLFAKYKESAFSYLRGMFSILIWDKETKTLYGARDPFGIKPLFYQQTDAGIMVASEKKHITAMLETEQVDNNALQNYLSFQFVPEPRTMTKGIQKLEAGYYFIKNPGQTIRLTRYWDV